MDLVVHEPHGQHTTAGLHPLSNVYCSYQHQPGHMDSGAHFFHLFPEELHETLLIFIGPSKAWAENAAMGGAVPVTNGWPF